MVLFNPHLSFGVLKYDTAVGLHKPMHKPSYTFFETIVEMCNITGFVGTDQGYDPGLKWGFDLASFFSKSLCYKKCHDGLVGIWRLEF